MDAIDKINALLTKKGMSGADLERAIGVSNSVYSQWNTKLTKPSKKSLLKVAETLGVDVSEIAPDKNEQKEKHSTDGEVLKALTPDRYRDFLSELSVEDLLALHAELGEELKGRMGK